MNHRLVILALAGLLAPALCAAQAYPSRPIRLLVPFPPGGGTDIISRTVGARMAETLGQAMPVDNRGGANGIIGTDLIAKAKPDGYTVGVVIATHAINPALYARLPYDSARDFAAVTLLAEYPFVIVVHPSLPVKSVRDLVSLARARPGELAYASSGNGSGPHLGMELLRNAAKIDLLHVPYKGAGHATSDLVAGQVQLFLHNFLAGMPMIKAGKLRPIAVTSAQRTAVAPELPTVGESGVPGYVVTGWYGMVAPAGTPAAAIARLHEAAGMALRSKDIAERLSADAALPVASSPEQFAEYIRRESVKWAEVIQRAGLKKESL